MKSISFILILISLIHLLAPGVAAQTTNSKPLYGLDLLALPKYDDVALKAFPKGWALGAFANTFGDALPAIEAIVKTGKTPLVRVHLSWDDNHNYGNDQLATIVREARRYQRLAVKYPGTRFELSPFCEHNLSNPDKYLDVVAKEAPSCFPVNTPWRGALSKKYKNETHGDKALGGRYNFSFDGSACVDADVTTVKLAHAKADVVFFWTYQFNLRLDANDNTPRSQRKGVPTTKLISSIVYLAKDKGQTRIPTQYIWKSHAEQNQAPVPEARALKPVLIAPVKASAFELVTSTGKVVASLPYYGTYGDPKLNLHRYYLGSGFGYEISEKAIALQGSPTLRLKAQGRIVGTVNPAFRDGSFR